MRATFSNTLLASPNPAEGRVGPIGTAWNGQPIIDDAAFFRAGNATVFGRGDGPEEFSFSVWAVFASEADAIAFATGHRGTLPVQADLTLLDDALTIAAVLSSCVRTVNIVQVVGVSVLVAYKFTGSKFNTQTVPTPPAIPGSDQVKVAVLNLNGGDVAASWTFDTALASAPRGVFATLLNPSGGAVFGVVARKSAITTTGAIFDFDAAVPASPSGYQLSVLAVL